jgi:hypothetical protein
MSDTESTDRFFTAAQVAAMTPDQILREAGSYGPALIGAPLYEAAQRIQRSGAGQYGPALLQDDHEGGSSLAEAPAAPQKRAKKAAA